MKKTRGFTLIELLTVIAIIGILTGIIVPNLSEARKSSRDAKRISDIKNIQLSLALFYSDYGFYPRSYFSDFNSADGVNASDGLLGQYLGSLPKDPSTGNNYVYASLAPTSNNTCTNANFYHLGAVLETNNALLAEDASLVSNGSGQTTVNGVNYGSCDGGNANFHGESTDCVSMGGAGSGEERCFDVTPR